MTALPTGGIPDTKHMKILQRFNDLIREGQDARDDHEDTWDRNLERYMGSHWDKSPPRGLQQFTCNRILPAILAGVAVQTEQRPRVELRPVENGDPPVVYLNSNGAAKATTSGIPFNERQLMGAEPLTDDEVASLMKIPNPQAATMPGAPPTFFTAEDFTGITDATATKAVQTAIDVMFDRTGFDAHFIENVTNKSIVGHQATLVQWDEQKRMPQLITLHPRNCWIDPTAVDIDSAEWFILATVMSVEKAVILFPEHEAVIRSMATSGQQRGGVADQIGQLGQPYTGTDFGRDMVTIYTVWERNQPLPMNEADAMQNGVSRMTLDDGVDVLHVNGKETSEDAPDWPTRPGILQTRILEGIAVLDSMECPYETIPVALNINLPIPYRPYGIGEPERLEDPQQLMNRLWSNMANHYKYFQSPTNVMSQSMYNALQEQGESMHSHPGRTIIVPDDLYIANKGRVKVSEDAPTFPQAAVNCLQMAITEFKEISGHTDVMLGKPHSGAESGKAITALQNAARGTLGYRSALSEKYVRQLVRLYVCILRDYMTPEDWKKMVSAYPIEVLTAIQGRTKQLDFDISVEIVSGRGVTREVSRNNAVQEFQLGLETLEGVLDRIGTENAHAKALQILAERNMMQQTGGGVPQPQDNANGQAGQ